MRIGGLRAIRLGDQARVEATVAWEERDHPEVALYVQCPAAFGADLEPNADAFLLAAAMPALDFGERRVQVAGIVCPRLRNGLQAAFRVVTEWFPDLRPPVIEATEGFVPAPARPRERVACFMSGGLDALATLRANRLDYPREHPLAIRDGLFLFGFNTNDFDDRGPVPDRLADFESREAGLARFAEQAELTLIPVRTNIRFLARDFESWNQRGMGAGLAAVAHCFAGRVGQVLIGSAGYARPLPSGTHALLDPNYSSARLEVRHDGLWQTRIEKTAVVADWPPARAVLRSCQQHELSAEARNCGRCNKCVRTIIHLEALGKLAQCPTFPPVEVTPELIAAAPLPHEAELDFIGQAIGPFRARGRDDLARAIEARLAGPQWWEREARRQAWKRLVRRSARSVAPAWVLRAARRVLR